MAKQRYVNTKFWDDGYIVTLQPLEKLLFLYLLTNPLTNIAGAYEITLRRISFDTGIDQDGIAAIFKKFATDKKITYRDGWVAIHNFIKNQSNNPKVEKGIEVAVNHCPDWIKQGLSIGFDSLSHLNSDSHLDSDSNLTVGADSPSGEIAQPPKRKRLIREVDARKDHPAIKLVHELSTRWPHKDLWDRIIRELGETPNASFFRESYETWLSVNGNPMNLQKWLFGPNATKKLPEVYGAINGSNPKLSSDPGRHQFEDKPIEPCSYCQKEICFDSHIDERRAA